MPEFLTELQQYVVPLTGMIGLVSGLVGLIVGLWTFRRFKKEETHRERRVQNQEEEIRLHEKQLSKQTDLIETLKRESGVRAREIVEQREEAKEQREQIKEWHEWMRETVTQRGFKLTDDFRQLEKQVQFRLQEQENRYQQVVQSLIDRFDQVKGERDEAQKVLLRAQAESAQQELARNQQELAEIKKAQSDLAEGQPVETVLPELGPLGAMLGTFFSVMPPFLGGLFGQSASEDEDRRRADLREELNRRANEISQNVEKLMSQLQSIHQDTHGQTRRKEEVIV